MAADVEADPDHAAALGIEGRRRLGHRGVEVAEDDARAPCGQRRGDGAADTSGAAGDERHAAGKFAHRRSRGRAGAGRLGLARGHRYSLMRDSSSRTTSIPAEALGKPT